MSKINLSTYIKSHRQNIGLTQKELAEKVGVTNVTISRYENDEREPNVTNFLKLCKALAINPNEMMWVVEGESNEN